MTTIFLVVSVFGLTLMILAVVFLIVGICLTAAYKNKAKKCTMQTTAEVVDITNYTQHGNNSFDSTYYTPVLKYYANGQYYTQPLSYSNNRKQFFIGQQLNIFYDFDDCRQFYVEGDNTLKIIGNIFTVLGITFLILTICAALFLVFGR